MGKMLGKKVRMLRDQMPAIWCPGCGYPHHFPTDNSNVVDGRVHRWSFNGDGDLPTFTPSMNVIGRCHSFVTAGRIQFLADSKHKLSGQTVELPDWPTEEGDGYDFD